VQAQILNLLQQQQRERDMAMVLVTHDLGVVAGRADEIAVMLRPEQIVERAPTRTLFAQMRMPYTEGLLKSIPKLEQPSHSRLQIIGGRPPDLVTAAARVQVRAAVSVRAGEVSRGGTAARRSRHTGPLLQVLVPRRHAGRQGGARQERRREFAAGPGGGRRRRSRRGLGRGRRPDGGYR